MPDNQDSNGDPCPMSDPDIVRRFRQDGYIGPINLLDQVTCRRIAARLKRQPARAAEWDKGGAVYSRTLYEIACLPQIIDLLGQLIPGPIMLWGASLILRVPGQKHDWHTDIETAQSGGRAVSVWIGLEGTHHRSGLELMARSHQFGQPVQAEAKLRGVSLSAVSSQTVEGWAKALSSNTRVEQPNITDGQAIVFDGRLWHGSANGSSFFSRRALLLQYAAPDVPIRRPDPNSLTWPFQQIDYPRPPAIMIAGSGTDTMNKLVPAPPSSENWPGARLTSIIHPIPKPLLEDVEAGWRSHHILRGQTSQVPDLGCHVSVLSPGKTPHPPHQHLEEEILFMLDGSADLTIVDDANGKTSKHTLEENSFAYYPHLGIRHTLTNNSNKPVTYLMFKWRAADTGTTIGQLGHQIVKSDAAFSDDSESSELFVSQLILEGPTQYLRKLHAHASIVRPGGGYAEHVDAHDVAILLISGQIQTLNKTVKAPSLVFYAGGQKHGLSNSGKTVARYVVFEFHGQLNGGLLPTRIDRPAIKAWLRQAVKAAMSRSAIIEALIRKGARLIRR